LWALMKNGLSKRILECLFTYLIKRGDLCQNKGKNNYKQQFDDQIMECLLGCLKHMMSLLNDHLPINAVSSNLFLLTYPHK